MTIVFIVILTGPEGTPLGVGLDILAYSFAALGVRWPKTGASLLAVFLAIRGFLPPDMGTLNEYAALYVLLGAGMRGDIVLRRVFTLIYYPLLIWVTGLYAPDVTGVLQSMLVWALFIGVVWLIGNASYGYTTALRRAHAAEAQLQRQVLARELHDTVARSFTQVAMASERARLRGGATADDLDVISEAATRGVDELRLMMSLLRDPSASVEALSGGTSLAEALTAAQKSLRAEGFNTAVSVEGDLAVLTEAQSATLAAVTAEAAANIVRHGDPAQPAGILVHIDDARADLTFLNSPTHQDDYASAQPMGLWGVQQRIESAGGTVKFGTEDHLWVVRVGLPMAEQAA
ncbi:MAG: histidine kinase [Propionibacteriales bacterium]|nr:histidine kinase [Propionibacteriales bacterium]